MSIDSKSGFAPWRAQLADRGFAFAPGSAVRAGLAVDTALGDWEAFAGSWDDLHVDPYMADRGRYRRRRHAVFRVLADGTIERQPHQPHYQALEYNPLHGGIQRWFEPVEAQIADGRCMRRVLAAAQQLFGALSPQIALWQVEVHQFRIEASAAAAGQPTPEGVHRDGVDWVLVLMIQRRNIAAGTTTIHDLAHHEIGSFTLRVPFDAALVDDRRCFHGVTAVTPIDPDQSAYRDVLVVTFRGVRPSASQQ